MGDAAIAKVPESHQSSTAGCNDDSSGHSSPQRRRGTFSSLRNGGLIGALVCALLPVLATSYTFREQRWSISTHNLGFATYPRQQITACTIGRSTGSELRATKIDQILEDLKTLTLLETSELVKKIEETFGVSASMAVSASAAPGGAPGLMAPVATTAEEEAEEEKPKKTSFDIVLLERPEEATVRMALFRALRKVTPDKPLTEVKAAIDNAPTVLKTVPKEEEAKEAVKIIEGAGGKAEVR